MLGLIYDQQRQTDHMLGLQRQSSCEDCSGRRTTLGLQRQMDHRTAAADGPHMLGLQRQTDHIHVRTAAADGPHFIHVRTAAAEC